jgi:ribosomal protein S18 acetylase RimI-like enzyme
VILEGITMGKEQDSGKRPRVEIREMEIDDLAYVFHLGERLFTSKKVPTLYRTWDEYEVTGIFQDDPEFCLIAEVDDQTVGFALGTTITKTRSAWKYGHLIWLGVNPEYQRLGVATRLFKQFRDKMENSGVRILLVDTESDNDAALQFFDSMGFRNPEGHLYLSLNLDQHMAMQRSKGHRPRRTNSNRKRRG